MSLRIILYKKSVRVGHQTIRLKKTKTIKNLE